MTLTYDDADRLLTTTDERGNVTTFAYDNNDRLTTLTDPDAKTTIYAYDVLDRVQSVTDRTGATSTVGYDSRQMPATLTDRNGNTSTVGYDGRQRPTGIMDAGGQTWMTGFDNEGLLVSDANPIDPPSVVKRNDLGRVVEATNALGHTVRMTRDAMQRVVQTFDPLGRATTFSYDKRGLLTSASEQGTGAAKYEHDPLGNVSKITDPKGAAWTFTYTGAGRLASTTDPLGRKWTHSYDKRGRRETTTFPDGKTETRTYDKASNLIARTFAGGPELTYTYDNLNRLTATNDLDLSYDPEGRITNCRQNGADFAATYDAGGRLTSVSYLDGAVVVTYTYDTRDRLTRVTDNVSGAQIDFACDDAGRVTNMTRSNEVNGTYTYDAAGRLTRIQEHGAEPGTVLDLKYTLNAAAEVASVDFTAPLLPGVAAAPAQTLVFNRASEIATAGYSYDARGRLTAAPGGKAYAWDGAARLTSAAGVALAYNGLDDIVSRTAGSAVTTFAHHYALGLSPIVVETPSGSASRCYVWTPGGMLLYSFELGTNHPSFYHFDRIGSTLALTGPTGAVTDRYAYGPYGEPLGHEGEGPSTQPFTYVGAYGVRAEGDLYHMRARYYDPLTARFLSRDPVPLSPRRPKRLNFYEYAAQNPAKYVDPRGGDEGDMFFNIQDVMDFTMFFLVGATRPDSHQTYDPPTITPATQPAEPFEPSAPPGWTAPGEGESILDDIEHVPVFIGGMGPLPRHPENSPALPAADFYLNQAVAVARAYQAQAIALYKLKMATQKPTGVGMANAPSFTPLSATGEGFTVAGKTECPVTAAREAAIRFVRREPKFQF